MDVVTRLADRVDQLTFAPPVTHVYNPARYAAEPLGHYLNRWARPGCKTLLIGMNPGPFGMAQTGVPFGDVTMVRDWLGIYGQVGQPPVTHPKRPVCGFAINRGEVSGARLWGWARDRYASPEAFFGAFFVWNYCPLCFIEDSGRNRTPDKLPATEREPLFDACDEALRAVTDHLAPRRVIGVGRFAETRVRHALAGTALEFGAIPHPSPANPHANRGWQEAAEKALNALGAL
jgi:single-strand selective monofunctional uracil DNA glycosylase